MKDLEVPCFELLTVRRKVHDLEAFLFALDRELRRMMSAGVIHNDRVLAVYSGHLVPHEVGAIYSGGAPALHRFELPV